MAVDIYCCSCTERWQVLRCLSDTTALAVSTTSVSFRPARERLGFIEPCKRASYSRRWRRDTNWPTISSISDDILKASSPLWAAGQHVQPSLLRQYRRRTTLNSVNCTFWRLRTITASNRRHPRNWVTYLVEVFSRSWQGDGISNPLSISPTPCKIKM